MSEGARGNTLPRAPRSFGSTLVNRFLSRRVLPVLALLPALVIAAILPARAVTGLEGFDAGLIITDDAMYGTAVATSMTDAQIDAFLRDKGGHCVTGADGSPCLKDATFDSLAIAASRWCPGAFAAGEGESAGRIIGKASRACGISPKVLLTILQKEQGLITTTNPTATMYARATGFACPDGSPCAAQHSGFVRQVYSAASRLQQYRLQPDSFTYRVGIAYDIPYDVEAGCGTQRVAIRSAATAALYNYTPYVPNAASLAAVTGKGDDCSSYGNRNLYRLHTLWFGAPNGAASTPTGPITRIAGADRYATAVAAAKASGLSTTILYIASGTSFPDSLTLGALASRTGHPILLTSGTTVPKAVSAYLSETRPREIRIAGSTGAVSAETANALSAAAGGATITRLGGRDRYETAAIIAAFLPSRTGRALVATGEDFPDALVAGAAAASVDAPLLLTRKGTAPKATTSVLGTLRPRELTIIGGTWSQGERSLLASAAGGATVSTLSGADRYATAVAVATAFFPASATRRVIATGADFADASIGAPLADSLGAPILLARSTCTAAANPPTFTTLERTVLGGVGAVSDAAARAACA